MYDDVDEEKGAQFAEFLNENVASQPLYVLLYCIALHCIVLHCIVLRRGVYMEGRGRDDAKISKQAEKGRMRAMCRCAQPANPHKTPSNHRLDNQRCCTHSVLSACCPCTSAPASLMSRPDGPSVPSCIRALLACALACTSRYGEVGPGGADGSAIYGDGAEPGYV